MAVYAVIDTNILVSALLSSHDDAATVQIARQMYTGEIIPVFSDKIIEEYKEVLCRKKFNFSRDTVFTLIETITICGELVIPAPVGEILPDIKDLPFYEAVMEKRKKTKAYLVTGNKKHFPVKPFIVTAREFIILNE